MVSAQARQAATEPTFESVSPAAGEVPVPAGQFLGGSSLSFSVSMLGLSRSPISAAWKEPSPFITLSQKISPSVQLHPFAQLLRTIPHSLQSHNCVVYISFGAAIPRSQRPSHMVCANASAMASLYPSYSPLIIRSLA